MILISRVKLTEIATPAPDTHDKLSVRFGMLLCRKKSVTVNGIELKLMSAKVYKGFYKLCDLIFALFIAENAIVKLHCERSTVADL